MNRSMGQPGIQQSQNLGGGGSGNDIVTSMVNEMGLTPSRAEFLQNQQGQPLNMQTGGMMPPGMGGEDYPESQLEMMESAARGDPEPYRAAPVQPASRRAPVQEEEPEYEEEEEEEEEKVESSFFDRLLRYMKTPVIVGLIFVLFSLPYTNTVFQQILPAVLFGNSTYYLLIKTVLVGLSFALVHLAIE
jgi:hypothetical protein